MKKDTLIILASGVVLISVILTVFVSKNRKSTTSSLNAPSSNHQIDNDQQNFKTYKSSSFDFEINIPPKFTVVEKATYVNFEASEGLIDLIVNRTNLDNLADYIRFFDTKRNLGILSERNLVIDNNESLERVELNRDNGVSQKVYYIYHQRSVYLLSTNATSLYSDLDQIAQSFRYTPN